MDKFTLVFRGGCPNNIAEGIDTILDDNVLQDSLFIVDVKTHSVDMVTTTDVRSFINRLVGKYSLSVLTSANNFICLGKLQDGAVVKTMQNQATGLFKQ